MRAAAPQPPLSSSHKHSVPNFMQIARFTTKLMVNLPAMNSQRIGQATG